jgi:hypothetical protein
MTIIEIETSLIEHIDAYLAFDEQNSLSFTERTDNGIFWDNNLWFLTSNEANPLAIFVFETSPERDQNIDDDLTISTVAKVFDKPPWFFRSFLDGWYYRSNSSMSIAGFLLGDRLRRKYADVSHRTQ